MIMNKIDELIKLDNKKYQSKYRKVLKMINQFDKICVFRHIRPDFDAIGSQLGLATFIKDNFPNKDVKVVGENHITLTPNCFPYMDEVDDSWFDNDFLAIVVDTSEKKRISDDRYKKAKYLIKIDHHPNVKPYGNIKIVDEYSPAAGEMVAKMCLSFKNCVLTKEAARWMYIALAGDSNRFKFSTTTPTTFAVAKQLLETGFDIGEVHRKMYNKKMESLEVTRYVLNNFKVSEHGVAYYILNDEQLKKFNLRPEQGKDNINLFDGLEGIKIWVSITEDKDENVYRVSIRSAITPIDKIATKYRGGGHECASGAKLKKYSEIDKLIKDLDNLLI